MNSFPQQLHYCIFLPVMHEGQCFCFYTNNIPHPVNALHSDSPSSKAHVAGSDLETRALDSPFSA